MSAVAQLRELRRVIARILRQLRTILIRQTARKAFDLPQLGEGSVFRLCSALIFSTLFFFTTLGIVHFSGLELSYRLGTAVVALLSALITSFVLVLWSSDEKLAENRQQLTGELTKLREKEAELQIEVDEELEAERLEQEEEEEAEQAYRAEMRRAERRRRIECPYCGESVSAHAAKCPHCGEFLDSRLRRSRNWSPGVAAVLSFLLPGVGQMYKGQVFAGLLWFFGIDILYVASVLTLGCCGVGIIGIPITILLHIICIFDAASGGDY